MDYLIKVIKRKKISEIKRTDSDYNDIDNDLLYIKNKKTLKTPDKLIDHLLNKIQFREDWTQLKLNRFDKILILKMTENKWTLSKDEGPILFKYDVVDLGIEEKEEIQPQFGTEEDILKPFAKKLGIDEKKLEGKNAKEIMDLMDKKLGDSIDKEIKYKNIKIVKFKKTTKFIDEVKTKPWRIIGPDKALLHDYEFKTLKEIRKFIDGVYKIADIKPKNKDALIKFWNAYIIMKTVI